MLSKKLTQKALVKKVSMLLKLPGFLPFGVTRLYTHSRSQTFVFMFHESKRTLKLGASSICITFTFDAPPQVDSPFGPNPVKPRPVKILAPYLRLSTNITWRT